MNRKALTIAGISLFASFIASAAFAQSPDSTGAVTIATLGVEKPAVIVSNPFYGVTNLFRGMKDSFASGKVEKLLVRVEVLNRKAAELLKMKEVAPSNAKLRSRAINEYQLAVYQYVITASKLTSADVAESDEAGALAQSLISNALVHMRLIDELLAGSASSADTAVLLDVMERFTDAHVRLFADVVGIDLLKLQLPMTGDMTEVRTAEMLSVLAKRAAALDAADIAQTLLAMRGSLLDTVANRLVASVPPTQQLSAKIVEVATFAAPAAMQMAAAPAIDQDAFMSLSQLAGSKAERAQTLSYLLSRPELLQNESLMALRNGLLMEVFAR